MQYFIDLPLKKNNKMKLVFLHSQPNQGPSGLSPRVLNGESSPINIIAPQARVLHSVQSELGRLNTNVVEPDFHQMIYVLLC